MDEGSPRGELFSLFRDKLCASPRVADLTLKKLMLTDMLAYAQGEGMKTISMFVDLTIKENNSLPFDSHPSAVAHRQYVQILGPYLTNLLSESRQK